jgi:hypothetical protein
MAKRTINDVIDQARIILQDKVTPYRYSDEELVSFFNNALYELKRLRPDAWLGSLGKDLDLYAPIATDLAKEVPFSSIFFQPVVAYVAGYAELRDDEFVVDNRAGLLMSSFTRAISAPSIGVV